MLSSSWGASGAFDDAFDDDDGNAIAVACVETHMVKYYQSEFGERSRLTATANGER